jgi:diguanylate cyclase (GGDEF)-like protein
MRVLIADDDAPSRLLVCAAVERLGHECAEAGDGEEALARFHELGPDVVITDLEMPLLDGAGLVRHIRSAPDVAYAYVVVVTAQSDEAKTRDAMEAGADDLILKPIQPADLERKLIAAQRVTSLHRQLHRDARQDALTGIGNRLRLAEDIVALCGRVDRYGHAYCVVLLDVDRFKGYNDGAGHRSGDEVLRAVAEALAATIRSGDTLYRYGGEEFLVLLPEQSLEGATLAAERLRAAVEALGLEHPEGGAVTVSAGVAGLGSPACTPEQLFELADRALYRAKSEGRNRVAVEQVVEPDRGGGRIRLLVVGVDRAPPAGADDAIEVVGQARGRDDAVELAGKKRPDVVLLDFDKLAVALGDIRQAVPGARIVTMSADDGPGTQMDMSRAGAVGTLLSTAPDEEIVRVIRSASRF